MASLGAATFGVETVGFKTVPRTFCFLEWGVFFNYYSCNQTTQRVKAKAKLNQQWIGGLLVGEESASTCFYFMFDLFVFVLIK